ncbi:MAG: signal peptidase II [Deltaproteobacteria bacterium]|nr:MAG: signal peptidase II [Deltaproteobacteria bacterium]
MSRTLRRVMLLSFALVLLLVDILTKWATVAFLRDRPPVVLLPVLDFRYIENRDIAFSLLEWLPDKARPIVIILLAGLMTIYVIFLFVRYAADFLLLGFGLSLILSGAIGNLLDRFTRGFVVDFIHVHYGTYSWPVFNVADICVSTGIGLIAIGLFLIPDENSTPKTEEAEASPTPDAPKA